MIQLAYALIASLQIIRNSFHKWVFSLSLEAFKNWEKIQSLGKGFAITFEMERNNNFWLKFFRVNLNAVKNEISNLEKKKVK